MRRSRLDIRFGRALRIGQLWRRCDGSEVWVVRQIHQADCLARLERAGECRYVPFRELRTDWERMSLAPPGAGPQMVLPVEGAV